MSKFYTLTSPRLIPAKQRTDGECIRTHNEPAFSGRHFIGNGVPDHEGGFSVAPMGEHAKNFSIAAGRIMINGMEVLLDEPTTYQEQPAKELGLTPLVPNLPPAEGRPEQVWLDVWTYPEDNPRHPPIEVRWAVRVKDEADPDRITFNELEGHHYYHLADIVRNGVGTQVIDKRRLGVTLSTVVDNLNEAQSELKSARGTHSFLDERLDVALNDDGTLKAQGALDRVVSEVETARGTQALLDERLDVALNDDGTLKAQGALDRVVSEVETARGRRTTLDERLDAVLDEDGKLKDDTVGETQLAKGAVTAAKLGEGVVTDTKLAEGSVLAKHLGDAAVTKDKLADGAVSAEKIANGAVTLEKLAEDAKATQSPWKPASGGIAYSEGKVGIGTETPDQALVVKGTIKATKFIQGENELLGSPWEAAESENNINYSKGNVGIGNSKPEYALDVKGTINADEIYKGGKPFAGASQWENVEGGIQYNGNVGIGTEAAKANLSVKGKIDAEEFTKNGAPFTGESVWQQNQKDISYKDGKVGIGITEPKANLDIANVYTGDSFGPPKLGEGLWFSVGNHTEGGDDGKVWIQCGGTENEDHKLVNAPLLVLSDKKDPPRIQFQQIGNQSENNPAHSSWIGHGSHDSSNIAIMADNVGIGKMSPSYQLHVNGNAAKSGGGSWTDASDKRLKKNIKQLKGMLEKLLQLRGVSFEWKNPEEHGNMTGTQTGMIGQEVETVFPEWVGTNAQGYKDLTFRGFEALTVEALRDLNSKLVEAHEELLKKYEKLNARVEKLEEKLQQEREARKATAKTKSK